MVDRGGQALHGGGQGHALAVGGVHGKALVHVHADDLGAGHLGGRLTGGGADAAAAGEDRLDAQVLIPVVRVSGDVGISEELVAVDILDGGVHAQLTGGGVHALDKAVAEALHGGNGHAAKVAQVGVAQLHGGDAGHVAAELFLIDGAVHVFGHRAAHVALADVQGDEADVGINVGHLGNGFAKGEAGHDDDIVIFVSGLFHHGHALGGGVSGGLVVGEFHAVGLAPGLAGLVGGLVKGLVRDVAVVRDHGDPDVGGLAALVFAFIGGGGGGLLLLAVSAGIAGIAGIPGVVAAAGGQGQNHRQSQQDCK